MAALVRSPRLKVRLGRCHVPSAITFGPAVGPVTRSFRIGGGDRAEVRVEDIGRYAPWRWICSLEGYLHGDHPDPKMWGTGWLVGSGKVITAGPCLFFSEKPGHYQRLDRIRVLPGRAGQSGRFGDQTAESFGRGWEIFGTNVAEDRSLDFGVLGFLEALHSWLPPAHERRGPFLSWRQGMGKSLPG